MRTERSVMKIQTKLKVIRKINSIFIMNKESSGHPLTLSPDTRGGTPSEVIVSLGQYSHVLHNNRGNSSHKSMIWETLVG